MDPDGVSDWFRLSLLPKIEKKLYSVEKSTSLPAGRNREGCFRFSIGGEFDLAMDFAALFVFLRHVRLFGHEGTRRTNGLFAAFKDVFRVG